MAVSKSKKNSIKTTRSNQKSSGLKRRFDLTNKRVQFFVVITIIAVLGGGYFTVRSFAAEQSYAYTPINFGYNSNDTFSVQTGNKAGGRAVTLGTSLRNRASVYKTVEPGAYIVCHISRAPYTERNPSLDISVSNGSRTLVSGTIPVQKGTTDFVKRCNNQTFVLLERSNVRLVLSNRSDTSVQFAYAYLQPAPRSSSSK